MIRSLRFATVLPVALALCVTACDKKPKTTRKPTTEKKQGTASVQSRFEDARSMLVEGKFAEAAKELNELGKEPNIKQPLYNWITLMEGLALLLDSQEPAARKVFAELVARGAYSDKEDEALMAKFFVNVGNTMSSGNTIPLESARDFDKWSFEGIGFLLYGLKDWAMEKPEEGVPILRMFADVAPEKAIAWASGPEQLKQLQDIAESCVADYQEARPALQSLVTATSVEGQVDALERAKAARDKMKFATKIKKELEAKIIELEPKITAAMAEKNKSAADDIAFDAKQLPAAKEKRAAFMSKFMFTEARTAIVDLSLKTAPAKEEQAVLARKSKWLANFKETLIEDINKSGGYKGTVNGKDGKPIGTAVGKADNTQVLVLTPKGPAPIPWSDISLESIYAMGKNYVPDDLPPQIMAFRKWHLGVFGTYAKIPDSVKLLHDAAAIRDVFEPEIANLEKPTDQF